MGVKGGVRPEWKSEACIYCGVCGAVCPEKAIEVDKAAKKVTLDLEKCVYCGKCIKSCPTDAWTVWVGRSLSRQWRKYYE